MSIAECRDRNLAVSCWQAIKSHVCDPPDGRSASERKPGTNQRSLLPLTEWKQVDLRQDVFLENLFTGQGMRGAKSWRQNWRNRRV